MKINAFCTADPDTASKACDNVTFCGNAVASKNMTVVPEFGVDGGSKTVYLNSMLDGDVLDSFCDHILNNDARAIVRASFELEEVGMIEARYKLSPIMLLHKLGVLERCQIVGGVCLDNDDLDLMAQEGVPLIVTPTASAGYGHGFAPVCAAMRRGVIVGLGTFDGKYNARHDIGYELEFLRITANAEMRTENALSQDELDRVLRYR